MHKSDVMIDVQNLSYSYRGEVTVPVLKSINFQLHRGEKVALVGSSGVGKSTLLHLLGLLDIPQSGEIIFYDNRRIIHSRILTDAQRSALRASLIGFVYQFHHLLPEFSALENVIIPQMITGHAFSIAHKRAQELLDQVGLAERMFHRPSQLSGGQQQRVAIARALANNPEILLADEPTGNLDETTARDIFNLFLKLSQERGLSIVMATHNTELRHRFDRVLSLQNHILHEERLERTT